MDRSSRARAPPLATASTQPRLPQRHSASPASGICTWPRSPAVPSAPRWMAPPATMPQPIPVATFTNSRSSTVCRQLVQYSPSAMMFTSLSTSTGTPGYRSAKAAGIGTPSHPGMIGGLTGPAGGELDRARHARCRRRGRRRCCARPRPAARRSRSWTQASTTSGPSAMSSSAGRSARSVPSRSADRQAAVGGAEVGGKHHAAGGVEGEPGGWPAPGGGPLAPLDQQSPRPSRASTRWDTVERASPVGGPGRPGWWPRPCAPAGAGARRGMPRADAPAPRPCRGS